jgi:hypothetical protein
VKGKLLSTAFMVVVACASTVLAPPVSAASGLLAGTWVSVDSDGSNQTLDIRGSGHRVYAMTYFDESATSACGGNPARISGPGFVDGDQVRHSGPVVCLPGGNVFESRFTVSYSYDDGTDTLTDDFGTVWHRAN